MIKNNWIVFLFLFISLAFAEDDAKMAESVKKTAPENYNQGVVLYKQQNFDEAASSFSKAMATEKKEVEFRSNYNLGNTKYRQGAAKTKADLSGAADLMRESLKYYQRAMDLNNTDEDAKFNYEYVSQELKLLDQQEKKSQVTSRKSQEKSTEEQKQDEKTEELKDEKTEEKKESSSASLRGISAGGDEAISKPGLPRPSPLPRTSGARNDNSSAVSDGKQMSKEEARMLLENYRQEEDAQGQLRDKEKGRESAVLKDW